MSKSPSGVYSSAKPDDIQQSHSKSVTTEPNAPATLDQEPIDTSKVDAQEIQYIKAMSEQLYQIGSQYSILSQIAWEPAVKENFFKHQCQKLPVVTYPEFKADALFDKLQSCRKQLAGSQFDGWLKRHMDTIENTLHLLCSINTPQFIDYSKALYGYPKAYLKDEKSTSLALANQLIKLITPMKKMDLGEPPPACILASTVAEEMHKATAQFGELAPRIQIVDSLSANALAGSEKVSIRRNACFTDRDVHQLIEHEINIHVATLLNGKQPGNAKLLGLSHAGSTKTQEGLAIFAELITGSMDLDRFSRLAYRVSAIQMALDGADFIEVYRYFYELTQSADQSFENTRRVFRGAPLTGGHAFTKDIVYLDGLLRVHSFLRATVMAEKSYLIPLLFAGRMDIDDLPDVVALKSIDLCQNAKYLPDWVKDRRFLFSYLSFSTFLNTVNMQQVNQHYSDMLTKL
ncbi:flavohemoglobin expression-modulating QEGLA motif protein [Aliikangiella maris]|uniref:Flavohemoglobin expression-modulating QEGLA motif protein n=2 Tax=Aliikangiella maris TaxID=3162458 RepID=A0ABV2BQF9_9GAMM